MFSILCLTWTNARLLWNRKRETSIHLIQITIYWKGHCLKELLKLLNAQWHNQINDVTKRYIYLTRVYIENQNRFHSLLMQGFVYGIDKLNKYISIQPKFGNFSARLLTSFHLSIKIDLQNWSPFQQNCIY